MSETGRAIYRPTWENGETYAHTLVAQINASGFKPNLLIGISGGGSVLASHLGLLLPWMPTMNVDMIRDGEKRIVASNPHINWAAFGKRKVLLVEDELETGMTAQAIRELLEQNDAEVKLACIFARKSSRIRPDFVLQEGVNGKVSFAWERMRKGPSAKSEK